MARTKGTGSITRLDDAPKARCRHWRLRVVHEGKVRTRRFEGTYSQAENALDVFIVEITAENSLGSTTFQEYAETWLALREASGELAQQTLDRDSARLRNLMRMFGAKRLGDIKRQDVQEGLQRIKNGENLSGRTLTGTTLNGIHQIFRQVMQDAVYDGYIDVNPVAMVRAPKKDTPKKQALSVEDVLRVLARLDLMPYDGHTIGVRFAILAGNRRGEIVGYEWQDIQDGCAVVRRSVSGRTGEVKDPKTENGLRTIPLLPPLAQALEEWKPRQALLLHTHGLEQTPETPVVTTEDGTRMDAGNLYRWWRNNSQRYFDVDCTLHELRHTFLTMLGNSGATGQALKSLAGWANISMADVYVHNDEDANRRAMAGLEQRLLGAGE